MANPLVARLVLIDKTVLVMGDVWRDHKGDPAVGGPADKKVPLMAQVGPVFYRPESIETYSEANEKNPDEMIEIVDTTHAHYEMWCMPSEGSPMIGAKETLCRRIPQTSVLYAEEVWNLDEAAAVVRDRLKALEEEDEEEDDEVPPGETSPEGGGEAASSTEVPAAPEPAPT